MLDKAFNELTDSFIAKKRYFGNLVYRLRVSDKI